MASKRKSNIPCMIPSKSKHAREEIILGSLPELLPTIPEDSILSISGEVSSHFCHSSSKADTGTETQKGGTYSCPKCRFESRDLNYFLDHMHNSHLDFRAQPTFYCLDCGVSVVRFEALALHNAKTHPKIMEGLVTASLTVNKRDGVTTVDQSLFTENGVDHRESGISLTKTPIAKMMKAKGEHKKIVVSHTVEVRRIDTGMDVDPSMLNNVPELKNGALSVSAAPAMPRTSVAHVNSSTLSTQVFHQHTPSLYSTPSTDSNKDLPKVMIPLSSIPTYDAAMDTSSFLKTSFGKFPYPTKAELCYLTVVSDFPEEQIKLWFTAQRLKQGISWSPEEIEEARRKMFNTVFQGGAPKKQPATQQRVNHFVTHHTVASHPGPKVPNFPMPKFPYGSLKVRPPGVIATQANLSTNPHVTRLSYSAPILAPEIQSAVRPVKVLAKNIQTAATEPDKSNGLSLEVAGSSGCVSSTSIVSRSSSSSSSCSSSNNYSNSNNVCDTVVRKIVHNSSPANGIASCSANISNSDEHGIANGKPNNNSNSPPVGLDGPTAPQNQLNIDITSKSIVTCTNHNSGFVSPQEPSRPSVSVPEPNNVQKAINSSIISDYPDPACGDGTLNINHASKSSTESTSSTQVVLKGSSSIADEGKGNKDFSKTGMSILQQLIKDNDLLTKERSCTEMKVNPMKLSFKRMKMSESDGNCAGTNQEKKSEITEVSAAPQLFPPPWGNKTPQQLSVLRQVFSSTHWPSSQQYEDLSVQTGLPKSEVVRWFSDSRYSQKNGQLKWLETYLRPSADLEEAQGASGAENKSPKDLAATKKKLIEQSLSKHLDGEAALNSGQRLVWQDSYSPLLGLIGSGGSAERAHAEDLVQPGVLQNPWTTERAEDQQQAGATQSLMEQQAEANQARYVKPSTFVFEVTGAIF